MTKDIKNSSYAGIELSELLSNYNTDREATVILTGNFNEITPLPSIGGGSVSGGGSPHKLYNKNSETLNLLLEKFPLKESEEKYLRAKLDSYWRPVDFARYFRDRVKSFEYKKKVSQNASNGEIEAL